MKRDMESIRTILLAVRDADEAVLKITNMDAATFLFHAQLLQEAGLVIGKVPTDNQNRAKAAVLYRLTWNGHDFADSIADNTIWDKSKKRIIGPSVSWSFDILKDVVAATIKESLGL